MSVNKYQPHVYVLPEDDANRQLANGFHLDLVSTRKMQALEEAGGWLEVLKHFKSDQVRGMNDWPNRFMVLLIDLDGREDRIDEAKREIPDELKDRVFILSTLTEPEDLRPDLGLYENIGMAMAKDCREGTSTIWGHAFLRHNADELERLRQRVRPILFS